MATADEIFRQGVAAHQAGDLAAAEARYRQLLAAHPDHLFCLANLAAILSGRGDSAEAERLYLLAVRANPDFVEAHFALGNLYRRLGLLPEAATAYEQVLRRMPDTPAALVNLGLTYGDAGNWPDAARCFARAAAVAPELPDVFALLGDALARSGRREEAVAALRQSVARAPDSPRAHLTLGLHLAHSGAPEEALASLRCALELKPGDAEAHNLLGAALDALGRADEAQAEFREALRLRPDLAGALANLGLSLGEQGQVEDAAEALRRSLELQPDAVTGSARLANLACSAAVTPEQLAAEHVAWARAFADPLTPAEPPKRRERGADRLRVGYVFGELRTRSAADLLESLLAHHDRDQFHVSAYACGAGQREADRLQRRADAWHAAAELTDDQLASQVRDDGIDILVDLNGHAAGNRLLAFARKPAPVQASLFSYPATTGMRAMDYRVTDPVTDPPGAEALYVEKLVRLPEVSWAYVPTAEAPPPNALPASAGRPFTFGCLNHPAKLSEPCVGAWAALLRAVPRSRLVLLTGASAAAADWQRERFASRGVAPDRLEFVGRKPAEDYFAAYRAIDMAIDPFPFNGALTTCDALWMGVPVLTLAGPDARGRQGASILTAVGLPEFIAETPEQLVNLAATWAGQRDSLAELRGSLRDMVAHSPLTAVAEYVRNLEAAYRGM